MLQQVVDDVLTGEERRMTRKREDVERKGKREKRRLRERKSVGAGDEC